MLYITPSCRKRSSRLRREVQALFDHLGTVLPAPVQPLLECLHRGRQDEDAHRQRKERPHLSGALPVDLEHDVAALAQAPGDLLARSAVAVAVHMGALEELARRLAARELGIVDEEILAPMLLARPGRPRGAGYRERDRFVPGEKAAHEGGFAGTRRRDDQDDLVGYGRALGHLLPILRRIRGVGQGDSRNAGGHYGLDLRSIRMAP